MKTLFFLLVFTFLFSGLMTSCSIDDSHEEIPTYSIGDLDDPIEPDREDD